MNIVVLSGGSGNDALIKGLESLYPGVNINVIVNAYDNGKSTGICRAVTDTLGVSDIRKNHSRMYKATHGHLADNRLLEFYEKRFNFTKGNEVAEIKELLKKWDLDKLFNKTVDHFFANEKAYNYEYKDFSVANIIYAQLYQEIGYKETNSFFCNLLGIKDFVTLNSFDNIYIKAQTQSGHIIEDEGETVFWNNPNDIIVKTIYELDGIKYGLNKDAIDLVKNADLIVVSTGTFWSSIQPTIEYLDFYKYINESKAKKVWAINNEEDGDSWGVDNLTLISYMEQSGLDLSDFTILLNADARESLRKVDNKHNFLTVPMGNNNGKHSANMYAMTLLSIYYDLHKYNFDKILFDFDDTLWSRDMSDINLVNTSIANVTLLNDHLSDASTIISGNSYDSIKQKLYSVYGTDLTDFNVDVWADANSTLFRKNKVMDIILPLTFNDDGKNAIEELKKDFSELQIEEVGKPVSNYKIKPLESLDRKLLVAYINTKYKDVFKAESTGKTTVDILTLDNTKEAVYNHCNFDKLTTLYIGDELDIGNDNSIAKKCTKAINVDGVIETNVLIKLLIASKEWKDDVRVNNMCGETD